jgi:protein-S-isoprenylcysteine O-methyltransferase Ste14
MSRGEVLMDNDNDDVMYSPALAPLALIVVSIAWLLQWLLPLSILSALERAEDVDPIWPFITGLSLVACGISLSFAGFLTTRRQVRDIDPWRVASVLVTDGVYAWTRNPGFLGLWMALTGIGVAFALDWLLIVIIPACALVSRVVVQREELFLEQKFGKAYLDYKRRVPRYFFIR